MLRFVNEVARVHVLLQGSLSPTVSTCSLIVDGDALIVVDPGLAPAQEAITDPLRAMGIDPLDVTDVVISHHHPDHSLNVALFPSARVHDHWAIYDFHGRWDDVEAEGRGVSANVQLLRTPGHTPEDISTVARVADGTVVFTHAWWTAEKPVDDPYCHDLATLRASRARILELATIIVPGHGAPFRPSATTPR